MSKIKTFLTIFLMGGLIANAQWSSDPAKNNRITPVGANTYNFEIGSSNDGNVYVTYLRPKSGNTASVLQVIDEDGNMQFSDEGLTVSHKETISWTLFGGLLLVDRDGNSIIAVTDCRNSFNQQMSYTLYKVSPTGEMLWGEDGLELAEGMAFDYVAAMSMVQIEDGSYVCAWTIMGYEDNVETSQIKMQRISQDGELLWSEKDMPQFNTAILNQYPFLVNANNNQVILMYIRGSGRHLMARKIDFDGSSVWSEDVIIYRGGFTIPPLQVILKIIPDQMGGAFAGWYDDRNYINQESTYVAHITSDGKLGFSSGEGGERVGYNDYLRGFAPEMYFDKEKSALYVVWRETSSGQTWQQITAQKLSIPSGELLWEPEGKAIAPLVECSIAYYSIQGDKQGNVAVFYSSNEWDPVYFYGWDKNKVTLLDSYGDYVWKDEIIEFANSQGGKGDLVSTKLINNSYWVAVWGDNRKLEGETGSNVAKIYMQRINLDGTLGDYYNNETYNIDISANPQVGGSVSGGGTFQKGTNITVKANPNDGYDFVSWTENDIEVSTSAIYQFTVEGNRTLVANFIPNISIKANSITENFSVIPSVITESAEFFIKNVKSNKGEIILHSITGQKVETIFSGHFHDGLNRVKWNVQKSKLSKGVYVVTFETDTERKALRIVIK